MTHDTLHRSTMQALVQDSYGEAEAVLRLAEVALPQVGATDVLVEVRAAGVDRGAWHLMAGLPLPVRIAGYGLRAPKTRTPGSDIAGVVVAVGAEVISFRVGDEVFGTASGAFAEYATAAADQLAPKPANLTFEQAAATPVSGITALQAVRDKGRVKPGDKVLVIGASGGVGTFAVQLATAFGATVTGVCSTSKMELVRSLGADHVIDYQHHDIAHLGTDYDVILDIGGNRSLSELRSVLTARGTLVITGGEGGGRWLGGSDRQVRALMLNRFVSQELGTFIAAVTASDLRTLTELIEAGQVTPTLDRSFPLREGPDALRYMLGGNARGKVVLVADHARTSATASAT